MFVGKPVNDFAQKYLYKLTVLQFGEAFCPIFSVLFKVSCADDKLLVSLFT